MMKCINRDRATEYCSTPVAQRSNKHINYTKIAPVNRTFFSNKFDKNKLPCPIEVLNMLSIKVGKVNKAGYWSLFCPFHKNGSEVHPSLNMHYHRGNYRCHACGAKGGDILKFYCEVTGKSFTEAAKELGAWREQ